MPILTTDRRTTAKKDQPKDKKSAQTLGVKEQKEAPPNSSLNRPVSPLAENN
jgi:hypothetical protein